MPSSFVNGERRRYIVVRSELRKLSAVIICGPETVAEFVWKMWSCMAVKEEVDSE